MSHKKGKGFRGDLSKCFSPEAQCHLPLDLMEPLELLQDWELNPGFSSLLPRVFSSVPERQK